MNRYFFALIAVHLFVTPAIAASEVSPARLAHDMRCYGYATTAWYYFLQQADDVSEAQANALRLLYIAETGGKAAEQSGFSVLMETQPPLQTVLQFAGCRNVDIDDAEAWFAAHPDPNPARTAEARRAAIAVIPGAQIMQDAKYRFEHPDAATIKDECETIYRRTNVAADLTVTYTLGSGYDACIARATAANNAK